MTLIITATVVAALGYFAYTLHLKNVEEKNKRFERKVRQIYSDTQKEWELYMIEQDMLKSNELKEKDNK